ncbi:hypothetical protein HCJ93_03580 [Streptomyces sp. SBST2-5]|uniref:Uncharacterized protein n=1 Tax=Streptomyces composti TaxID=2720025 RepID=A0ABX1A3L3_9ACTN|nr:hypothetical protein [Streptomyces composti]NJP49179.1 hypothetical protein [Streptomyces composti]
MRPTRRISEVVVRVVVTVVLGGLTYLITEIADQPEIWQITMSLFIGGASFVVQQLADFERRLDRGLVGFNETTRLFSRLDVSPVGAAEVRQLANSVAELDSGRPDFVYGFVRAEIRRTAALVEALRGNHADYRGEDRDWLLNLTRCASRSIDAVSTSVDRGFWETDLGRHYEAAQEEAVERGVRVRRLIILNTPGDLDAEMTEMLDRQKSLGIDVRTLVLSTLEARDRRDAVKNFVVFDEAVSYEMTTEDNDPSRIYETSLVFGERVAQRTGRFEVWWARGQ